MFSFVADLTERFIICCPRSQYATCGSWVERILTRGAHDTAVSVAVRAQQQAVFMFVFDHMVAALRVCRGEEKIRARLQRHRNIHWGLVLGTTVVNQGQAAVPEYNLLLARHVLSLLVDACGLHVQVRHISFKYLLKADDDSFVCVQRVATFLHDQPDELKYKIYAGVPTFCNLYTGEYKHVRPPFSGHSTVTDIARTELRCIPSYREGTS